MSDQIDVNAIADALNDRLNSDCSNLSNTGKSTISIFGMPSTRYIDLTLGSSGADYTAPATGWVYFNKGASSGKWMNLINVTKGFRVDATSAAAYGEDVGFIPVAKNDVFRVNYTADQNLNYFRFIYAEGEKNV